MEAYSLQHDLDAVFNSLKSDWRDLSSARIFMTGGTGLIGRWMLEALTDAQRRLRLDVEVTVLTRDPHAFALKAPHLAGNPALRFIAGDILETELSGSPFTHVIHAATDASAELNETDPRRMFDTIVNGTRRTLDLAVACRAKRYFFLSSGAVYGAQPWDMTHVAEDWAGGPDPLNPRNRLCRGQARSRDAVRDLWQAVRPRRGQRAHLRAARANAVARHPFRRGQFHPRRDGGAADPRSKARARRCAPISTPPISPCGCGRSCCARTPGAAYNVGSEEAVSIADLARAHRDAAGRARDTRVLGQARSRLEPRPLRPLDRQDPARSGRGDNRRPRRSDPPHRALERMETMTTDEAVRLGCRPTGRARHRSMSSC